MKVTGPRFWIGQTHYRLMLKEVPMPWNFPVEVNNLEAEAFCNWKSSKIGKSGFNDIKRFFLVTDDEAK